MEWGDSEIWPGLVATLLRCFCHKYISVVFLYLVCYCEEKDEGWQLQSVQRDPKDAAPFALVHSVWSKLPLQVAQPERKKCSKSKQVMVSWWEMCISELHAWIIQGPSWVITSAIGAENPSSQLSYKSVRQAAAITILLTLKMLNIKIKLISYVWILLNPVKHVSRVTSILFTS